MDGWKVLVYFFAFSFLSAILLGIPAYFWQKGPIQGRYEGVIIAFYLCVYLPVALGLIAVALGSPVTPRRSDKAKESSFAGNNTPDDVVKFPK